VIFKNSILGLFSILCFCRQLPALELPVGAKAGGMGDAYIVSVDNALAIYHNPAKVAFFRTIYSDISFGTEGFPFVDNWSLMY